ncbi:MAG: dUTP diphosphatase [Proteobacteria bacterium]|nr:dUTP diphosphatase [Pseudomonadota bacterium]
MISLRSTSPDLLPAYGTAASAAADLRAAADLVIYPGERAKVSTGVWIDRVNWDLVPKGMIPELQIRARSGLAFKHGIMLTNGIGTIDADFPDEICVLLYNSGREAFPIQKGDRIAQIILNLVVKIPGLAEGGTRSGGFGSTGVV